MSSAVSRIAAVLSTVHGGVSSLSVDEGPFRSRSLNWQGSWLREMGVDDRVRIGVRREG